MNQWLEWLRVLVIFGVGLIIVMIIVKMVIKWADRSDAKEDPPPLMPVSEPEKPKVESEQVPPRDEPPVQFNPPKINQKKRHK